jgi:hypothetical protein
MPIWRSSSRCSTAVLSVISRVRRGRCDAGVGQGGGDAGDEARVGQLVGGDVDVERQRAGQPGGQLFAGDAEHPVAERQDQAGAFRGRDEVGRSDHASGRVLPADQRLDAARAAVDEVDDGW